MEKKTFYVRLEHVYEDIEVEAETKELAEEEAKSVVRRGWISPSYTDVSVSEE